MKSSSKVILFILISFLCGIWVVQFYLPPPWLDATHLLFLEFPPFSLLKLISLVCVLLAGISLGTMARKYAGQAESKLQKGFAATSIFLNAIILILPVLNLVSMFIPRTITRVVDFKIDDYYICVTEINAEHPWRQEVNFDDDTVVYERDPKADQHKRVVSLDTIQPGQVVEIRYVDNDTSRISVIKALSITILEGQHGPYRNENCGSTLP